MNSNVKFAILGAILAGLTQLIVGVLIESIKSSRRNKAERRNFSLVVRLELEATAKQLDKLKAGLNERGYYPFANLNSLKANIERLEPNIAQIYKTGKDTAVQTDFVTAVTDLSDLEQDLRGIERYLLDEKDNLARVKEKENNKDGRIQPTPATQEAPKDEIKSKDPVTLAEEDFANTIKLVDQQRTARLVEVVDIKRRCDTLIEKLRVV